MSGGKIIHLRRKLTWLEAIGYMLWGAEIGFMIGQWLDQREVKRFKREVA